jgi:hypothetical protein
MFKVVVLIKHPLTQDPKKGRHAAMAFPEASARLRQKGRRVLGEATLPSFRGSFRLHSTVPFVGMVVGMIVGRGESFPNSLT